MKGFEKIELESGLRVIAVPQDNTKAVTGFVLVTAGSKYETKQNNGISHFLEHMFFKGTEKRPTALEITETLDNVGGIYNAFTSKEFTGYFAKVAKDKLELALDWLSDIFLNSKLETQQIEKEKGVITEEINMYLDTPTQYIGNLWEEVLYGDQPAGWKTIGTKENVAGFKKDDFTNYLKKHYCAKNTLVCVAGNFDPKKTAEKMGQYFEKINKKPPAQKSPTKEEQKKPQQLAHYKETDQTHLCLGARAYNLFDEQKYAQGVLATILGGNMSSRLFSVVREKHGLAYHISTSSQCYTDTGYIVTQAGVPHKNLDKVIKLILKGYKRIRENDLTKKELQKAKDYIKGTTILKLESSDARASFFATQELLTDKIMTPEQKFAKIEQVSIEDVKKAAQEIFRRKNLNLALIGPHKECSNLIRTWGFGCSN